MRHAITPYGFQWGPAAVTRLCDDPKHGVWLEVAGAHENVEIRITKAGKLRVGPVRKQRKCPSVASTP